MSHTNEPEQPHFDGTGELNMRAPLTLAEALRALPQAAPEPSAWPALAAQLAASTSPRVAHPQTTHARGAPGARRFALPIAIAAAAVLAFVATTPLRSPAPERAVFTDTQTSATNPAAAASSVHNVANDTNSGATNRTNEGLAALQSRSHVLERWLGDIRAASAPRSAQDLAASAELEDMIGLVDVQLSGVDDASALPLWRRRVSLLEDLAMLRYGANLNQFKSGLSTATAANNPGGVKNVVW
jgi:hypothetical protein